MRKIPIGTIIALTLTLSLRAATPEPPSIAVIVVDPPHCQVGQPDGVEGVNYSVPPSPHLVIDARAFDFTKSLYPEVRPNAIQLIIGDDRMYSATWNPSGRSVLSASTLTPINDAPPFGGLTTGDRAIVAIGEQRLDPATNEIILKVLWAGMVNVK